MLAIAQVAQVLFFLFVALNCDVAIRLNALLNIVKTSVIARGKGLKASAQF